MSIPILQESQVRFFNSIYKPRTKKLPVPYDNLNSGKKVLVNDAECDQYINLFGGHHFHKLYRAFKSTKFSYTDGKEIEIIDWGCGQALATCILIDYFIERQIHPSIVSITLVEPSLITLSRGCNFTRQMLQSTLSSNCEVRIVNKYMDSLNCSDFATDPNIIKIHLFSNIIDVEGFDLYNLYKLITNCFQGVNRIICTSPYQVSGNCRLDTFHDFFCEHQQVKHSFYSNEDIEEKIFNVITGKFELWNITRYERQFTTNLQYKENLQQIAA